MIAIVATVSPASGAPAETATPLRNEPMPISERARAARCLVIEAPLAAEQQGRVPLPCSGGPDSKLARAIVLDAGGAQTRETVLIDRRLPGQELLKREHIAAARFLDAQCRAAADWQS